MFSAAPGFHLELVGGGIPEWNWTDSGPLASSGPVPFPSGPETLSPTGCKTAVIKPVASSLCFY